MKSTPARLIVTACVASALLPLAVLSPGPALASSFDLQGAPVLFANGPSDEDIGEEASVGFSHRYDNVVTLGDVSVDALVSLVSTTNLDSDDNYSDGVDNLIDYLDNSSSSFPNALRTQIDIASGPEAIDIGEAVIRVAFVQAGTRIPLTLQNAVISVKDVDESQFVEFTAISSYTLTSDTALEVATPTSDPSLVIAGSTRFFEPNGSSATPTNQRNWVEVSYSQLSFVDIKIGAHEEGSAFFDIDFAAAGFTTATNTVAITAPSYTVTYNNNGSSETPPTATTGSGTVSIASASNRTGYTFIGWNTASDGTGLDIAAESNLPLSANITLYAQWSNNFSALFANGPCDQDIGEEASVGFSHRYDNVVTLGDVSVDALVSLVSTSNLDNDADYSNGVDNLIDYLDRSSSSAPNTLTTRIDIASGPETIDIGEAVIRVSFVRAGTRTPLTLQNAVISVKDVDDSQYVEFAAISSYKLTSDTALQVATNTSDPSLVIAGSTRFFEPNGSSSSSTNEPNWVEVSYSQLSFVDIKIGALEEGMAEFYLDFAAAGFTTATTTAAITAPSYTVTYNNNGSSETPPTATTGSGTVSIASASNRTGYTFIGWNTASDGTGLDIAAESNLPLSANITLYAQWSNNSLPSTLDPNGAPVLFANGPSDEDIGHGADVGFSHRYDNVVQIGDVSVDALVSLVSTTNLDCDDDYSDGADNLIDYLDRSSSSFPNALRTQIDIASGPETIDIGEAVIRVSFVRAGTRTPLTLQNVMINVKDVDDSQFVEFAAISSYKLTSDTALQVATPTSDPSLVIAGSTRFFEPNGTGTTSTDERNWVEVTYSQLSFVDIKIGALEEGSAFFDVDFAAAGFTAAITQPMAAPSYTVTYDNNGSSETPPAATTGSGTVSFAPASNRAGYTFIGWNTASDGTGLDIAAESNLPLSANVTLFAQWSVTPTTTPVSTNAPTTTSAITSTPAPSATVSVAVSLPATGSDTSQLVLALLGLCLVGIGIASRKMRPRHDSNMRPMD